MYYRTKISSLLVLLLAGLTLEAHATVEPLPVLCESGADVIYGQAKDAQTGAPVAGLRVMLFDLDGMVSRTYTDDHGRYVFRFPHEFSLPAQADPLQQHTPYSIIAQGMEFSQATPYSLDEPIHFVKEEATLCREQNLQVMRRLTAELEVRVTCNNPGEPLHGRSIPGVRFSVSYRPAWLYNFTLPEKLGPTDEEGKVSVPATAGGYRLYLEIDRNTAPEEIWIGNFTLGGFVFVDVVAPVTKKELTVTCVSPPIRFIEEINEELGSVFSSSDLDAFATIFELNSGSFAHVAQMMLSHPKRYSSLITSLYSTYLQRIPSSGELTGWADYAHQVRASTTERQFCQAAWAEISSRFAGDQQSARYEFIRRSYLYFVGRKPSASELNFSDPAVAGELDFWPDQISYPEGICDIFHQAPETNNRRLSAIYQRFLHRDVDPFGYKAFIQFAREEQEFIEQVLVLSPEYSEQYLQFPPGGAGSQLGSL